MAETVPSLSVLPPDPAARDTYPGEETVADHLRDDATFAYQYPRGVWFVVLTTKEAA